MGTYWFLPGHISFSKVAIIQTKIPIANRFLLDENKWGQWFPGTLENNSTNPDGKIYRYKSYDYSIQKKMLNAAGVSISNKQISLNSLISMISINSDSIAIEWKSEMPETANPIYKIKNYLTAKKLQNNMGAILSHLKLFLEQKDKVYGIHLHEIISKDSTLIATKCVTKTYPATADIYRLISTLKKYIISQGAKENNFPMLHVKKVNDTTFEGMLAIPVNKDLKGNDSIFNKRFVPWKVLTAEVRGGDYTVNEALHQMATYINDYRKTAMAIPFASLVTDRSQQPDTLKWITRIYTPVP
jgi:hypothetical protein